MRPLSILVVAALAAPADAQAPNGLSIRAVSAQELSNNGTTQMVFRVSVTRDTLVAAGQVTVMYRASSGTAVVGTTGCQPGIDVVLQPSALTILPTQNGGDILVTLCSDNIDEPDSETFTVDIFDAVGASIVGNQATGTILDDDPPPTIEVLDATASEGGPGPAGTVSFTVRLSTTSGRAVSFNAGTTDLTAQGAATCAGTADFVTPPTGPYTIPAGTPSLAVRVTTCADAVFEGNQTFRLNISNVTNATVIRTSGTGTISEDDAAPVLAMANAQGLQVTEGNTGTTAGSVQVTLTGTSAAPSSVSVTTGGTATVGTACGGTVDVAFTPPNLQWAAGDNTPRTITWQVCGDPRDDEDTETFQVTLAVASGATINLQAGNVTATIADDDATPSLVVNHLGVDRPSFGGQALANVSITLSAPSNRTVTLSWASEVFDGKPPAQFRGTLTPATGGTSCSQGTDFLFVSHRASFPAGTTSITAAVTVCNAGGTLGATPGRLATGSDIEVFAVRASAVTNATVGQGVAVVGIRKP